MKRRRFLALVAATGTLAATPARAFRLDPVEWRGTALGAAASLTIHHEDRAQAVLLLAACEAELARLEAIFSLYRPDSALSRLNRQGGLAAPPLDLVALLAEAGRLWRQSHGHFDPTVQPLWELYARHFDRPAADPAGPAPAEIEHARTLIGWDGVEVSPERVSLDRPGMALTLNGIAQGYITDRIAHLLAGAGMRHVLVNMGEIAVLGGRGDGHGWRVQLPDNSTRVLSGGALAVSMPDGTRFSPSCHHLFDPATGRSAASPALVVVQADSATAADAISTAIAASGGRLRPADFDQPSTMKNADQI